MRIAHDLHIHTTLSICADETATLDNYLKNAKELGLEKIGISNHFWDEKIPEKFEFYKIQNLEHLMKLKPELDAMKRSDVEVLFGCETEYAPHIREVAITEETAEQFDYILVPNSHTHVTMPQEFYYPYEKHRDFMIQAFEDIVNSKVSRYITAVAHPFEAVCCPYDKQILINMISDDTFKFLFDKAAKQEIAFEINVSSMHTKKKEEIVDSARIRMFRLAKECGCKFIFGSDSHNSMRHSSYGNAQFVADLLELKESDIAKIAL